MSLNENPSAGDTAWQQYAADFAAMSDAEIKGQCEISRNLIDEEESWLEAVASWERAGRPRPNAARAST